MGVSSVCVNLLFSLAAKSGFNIKELLLELGHSFLRSILVVEVI